MNYCEGPVKSEFSEDIQYIIDNTPYLNRLIQEITTEVNIKEIAVPVWKHIKNKNDYSAENEVNMNWKAQHDCAKYSALCQHDNIDKEEFAPTHKKNDSMSSTKFFQK